MKKVAPKKRRKEVVLHLPHLGYAVTVQAFKKGDLDNADGYSRKMCAEESLLCVPLPITGPKRAGILVHEIVHILQHICESNNMTFEFEREHMAYIAGWLFKEVSKL